MKTYTTLALMSMLATGYSKSMSLSLNSPYSTDALTACPGGTELNGGGTACIIANLDADGAEDFKATNLIQPRSQFREYSAGTDSNTIDADTSNVAGSEGHRMHKYTVTLTDASVGYRQCRVLNKDSALASFVSYAVQSSAQSHPANTVDMNIFVAQDKGVTDDQDTRAVFDGSDSANHKYTCSFYLLNNEFIGDLSVGVAFEKSAVQSGQSRLTQASLTLRFSPSTTDPVHTGRQENNLRDVVVQYGDGCKHNGGYLTKDGNSCPESDQTASGGTTTTAGNIHLHLSGVFLDTRYKVVGEGGAGALLPDLGGLSIQANGIDLKGDYLTFNNGGSGNTMLGSGINMQPLSKANSKTPASVVTHQQADEGSGSALDFSNKAQLNSLPAYSPGVNTEIGSGQEDLTVLQAQYKCVTDGNDYKSLSAVGDCSAQYVLNHVLEIEYKDLPQFDSSYVDEDACQGAGCPAHLAISGLGGTIDGAQVSLSVSDLPTSAPLTISVKGPKLTPKGNPILKPGPYKLSTLYDISVGEYELKKLNGSAPTTMDDILTLKDLFTFATNHPNSGLADTSLNAESPIALDDTKCAGLAEVKLHELGTDPQSHYERIFQQECDIEVPKYYIGTKYEVFFRDGVGDDDESSLEIIEDDLRAIRIGNTALNTVSRTSFSRSDVGLSVIARNIELTMSKDLPNMVIPAGFANAGAGNVALNEQAITFAISSTSSALNTDDSPSTFTTPSADSFDKKLILKSNKQCTGSIDLSFDDQTLYQSFAKYRVRIPCSRMSVGDIEDEVDIEFKFSARLDLAADVFEVDATPNTNDNGYNAEAFIGTCAHDNSISKPADGSGCGADVLQFANVSGVLTLFDKSACPSGVCTGNPGSGVVAGISGLNTLDKCSTSSSYLGDNLIVTFPVAMEYERTDGAATGFSASINYCDSQEFSVTVNRAKTATITAATIKNTDLTRAVIVKDIAWISAGCGADEYQLVILVASMDKLDITGATFTASELSRVVLDPAEPNVNGMSVDTADNDVTATVLAAADDILSNNTDSAEAEGNHFKVHGQCVAISEEEGCDVDTGDEQNGDSWSDYSQPFETNVVMSGTANAQEVDTKVKITLTYLACPVGDQAETTGQLKLGLQSSCKDKQNDDAVADQSLSQPAASVYWVAGQIEPTNLHFDCKLAFSNDVFQIKGDIYAIGSDCTDAQIAANTNGCGLLSGTHQSGWTPVSSNVKLNQYSTVDGSNQGTEAHLCKCEIDGGGTAGCEAPQTAINGLQDFKQLSDIAADSGLEFYQNCGVENPYGDMSAGDDVGDKSSLSDHGSTPANFLFASIPLAPLAQASDDEFRVTVEVVLQNSLFPARRRLLRATHKLKSTASSDASTPGFRVLESSVVEESNQDAPAPDAPEQSVEAAAEEPAAEDPVPSHEHDSDDVHLKIGDAEGSDAYWALAGIIIASIWVILELVDIALRCCGGRNSGPSVVRAVGRALGGSQGYTQVSNPVFNTQRSSRFSNLRY